MLNQLKFDGSTSSIKRVIETFKVFFRFLNEKSKNPESELIVSNIKNYKSLKDLTNYLIENFENLKILLIYVNGNLINYNVFILLYVLLFDDIDIPTCIMEQILSLRITKYVLNFIILNDLEVKYDIFRFLNNENYFSIFAENHKRLVPLFLLATKIDMLNTKKNSLYLDKYKINKTIFKYCKLHKKVLENKEIFNNCGSIDKIKYHIDQLKLMFNEKDFMFYYLTEHHYYVDIFHKTIEI